jgi:hypothetical protein
MRAGFRASLYSGRRLLEVAARSIGNGLAQFYAWVVRDPKRDTVLAADVVNEGDLC